MIGYEEFDELMSDYYTISNQLDFLQDYNEDIKYDLSLCIGGGDYMLKITIWKI
jgi:hypothetical protein